MKVREMQHEIKEGETLSGIAERYGLRWTTIYHRNKHLIDAEARRRGCPKGGDYIFPKTKIIIPKLEAMK